MMIENSLLITCVSISLSISGFSLAEQTSKSATPPSQPAAAPASTFKVVTTLDGNVYKSRFMSGCTPNQQLDFISAIPEYFGRIYPEDCSTSFSKAPVIQWPQAYLPIKTDVAEPWTISLSKDGSPYLTRNLKFPQLQLTSNLPPGKYEWTVSYRSKNGQAPISQVRRFWVTESSINTPNISADAIVSSASSTPRPRMLPKGLSTATILARINASAGPQFDSLKSKAKILQTKPVDIEPAIRPLDSPNKEEYALWLGSLRAVADAAASDLNILGYVGKLTNDRAMIDAGKRRLLALANWDPINGVSNYATQDQVARQILIALCKGYDYFYDELNQTERVKVISVIKIRLTQMTPLIANQHLHKKDSHGVTNINYLLNVLLLLAGDPNFNEASSYLKDTYSTFLVTSAALGGDDGAFQNGTGYGWYVTFLESLISLKNITGYDFSTLPYFSRYLNYLIAFTAPLNKEQMTAFGDDHTNNYNYAAYAFDTLQAFALLTKNAQHEWYFRANPNNVTSTSLRPSYYFTLLALGYQPATPLAPSQDSWFFANAGLASLTSKSSDPYRSSIAFRSSEWGAYNHSYADQNSFTLVSKGKDMLISSGYYYVYGSAYHKQTRATRSHNALSFDRGIGQSEPITNEIPKKPGAPVDTSETAGQLYNGAESNGISVVTGDASKAYRRLLSNGTVATWEPLLNNAIRSIAYFKEEKIVAIYDWATSTVPRSWELNFHAPTPFIQNPDGQVKVINSNASICLRHYNFPSKMSVPSDLNLLPEKSSATQYHLRSNALTPSTQLIAVTLIREDCSNTAVDVSFNGTSARVAIGNKGVDFDRKTLSILSR